MPRLLLTILLILVIAGCADVQPQPTPPPIIPTLKIYHTRTPSPTADSGDAGTPTPLPSATPTPRTYTVRLNDTYGTIAARFGVTVNDLVVANPDINPNALIVGMVLIIPPESAFSEGVVPTPTAVSVQVVPPDCLRTAEGGAWCFTEVKNLQPFAVESVLVEFRLSSGGEILDTRIAPAPLNSIPPGGSLPVGVFFPPNVPADILSSAALAAALPLEDPGGRYLQTVVDNMEYSIAGNRLSASMSGSVRIEAGDRAAQEVWVLAVARNMDGKVAGIRRWQWQGEVASGQSLPFSFFVYSQGVEIESVEIIVEARP